MSYFKNVSVQASDSASIDAFGRWRVSNITTLFDSELVGGNVEEIWDIRTGGGGTITYNNSEAELTLSGAGYVISQTFQRFKYQPGKSQLVLCTFNLNGQTPGVVKRLGYFNALSGSYYTQNIDGLYLEDDGDDVYFCMAKDGAITKIKQNEWNIDKMDGNGPSGITADWTKAQILFIDFEWLGVGRVRMGFVIDGNIFYCHAFNNANNVSMVYMNSPHHSIRYEIRTDLNIGATLNKICSTVQSEGGQSILGVPYSVYTPSSLAMVANIPELVCGVRMNPHNLNTVYIVDSITAMADSGDRFLWLLCVNPTYTGTTPVWSRLNRGVEYALGQGDNEVSDYGTVLTSGFVSDRVRSTASTVSSLWRPGSTLDDQPQEVWLVVKPITTGNFRGSMDITLF